MNPFGPFRFLYTVYQLGRADRKRFNVGFIAQFREILALHRLNGLEPHEYFEFNLADPSLTWEHKESFLSYNQACALHRELAPEQDRSITTKFLTQRYFEWFDIPMPRTYGLYDPRFGRTADGKPLTNFREFCSFLENLSVDKFVLKPASCAKGEGITVVVGRDGSDFIASCGTRYSAEQLFARCHEGWTSTYSHTSYGLLIQEYVRQHEILHEVNPHSLNCFRAITLLNDRDEVEVLATEVKFGVGDSETDNVSRGGFASRVDDNGILQPAYPENADSTKAIDTHPTTGRLFTGITLPYFPEAVALAKRAQLHLPQLRTLAWDIAITNTGPIIIESNVFWGHTIQIATGKGLITPGLREILNRIRW